MPEISANFDAGAIQVVTADSPGRIDLKLRSDSGADIRQWFYFRVSGVRDQKLHLRILNAGQSTYPRGWVGYRACASYDRHHWFRVDTAFDGQIMTIDHHAQRDNIYFAYFEPYPWDRHLDWLGRAEDSPLARVTRLGATLDGRDLDLVTIGAAAPGRAKVWVIARQHPGETMAEWFVEGLLERLLTRSDPVARHSLARAVFHVVPNMNPDGSVRGNLRTNASGANLNREWLAPSMERSPEVMLVRSRMLADGCDLLLDVHGDEALPYVFIEGPERVEGFTETQRVRYRGFLQNFLAASPDFQTEVGYPQSHDAKANLALASKWASHQFGGLSMTLEMPFKDNANDPDPVTGWSSGRSRALGAAALQPVLLDLRTLAS